MTTWLGLHFGLVLTHFTEAERRLKHWAVLSTVLVTLGLFISIFWGKPHPLTLDFPQAISKPSQQSILGADRNQQSALVSLL
jgi:hypothetical protein